jgi:KEOPS complex subunit Pcc1
LWSQDTDEGEADDGQEDKGSLIFVDEGETIHRLKDMKGCAEFLFQVRDKKSAENIYQALSPEMEDEIHRSNADLVLCEDSIRLELKGDDVASLRAALNTWMRLIKIAFEMVDI